jgi:peptidoglycan-associated lipoprotein
MPRLILLAALGLAACAPDPTRTAFRAEAGSVATGGFGDATASNVLLQSGQVPYAQGLSARFRAEVPAVVTFAFNSAELDAEARAALALQAAWIRQFPEVRFAVTGHADLVGPESYNRALGLARARAAVAFLVSQGVDATRLEALTSEGETEPLVPTEAPERRNRRAVTDVRGFVQGHPNVLNGKYAAVVFRDYVASAGVPATTQGITGGELAVEE